MATTKADNKRKPIKKVKKVAKKTVDKKKKPKVRKTKKAPGGKSTRGNKVSDNKMVVKLSSSVVELVVKWNANKLSKTIQSKLKSSPSIETRGYVFKGGCVRPSARYAYNHFGLDKKRGSSVITSNKHVSTQQFARYDEKNWVLQRTGDKRTPRWVHHTHLPWSPKSSTSAVYVHNL